MNAPALPNEPYPAGIPWRAELELCLALRGNRTILARTRHLGPLRVQRPFYPESRPPQPDAGIQRKGSANTSPAHVYLIHPPGGVVGGDRLALDIDTGPGAVALCTTPGSGKFYRSAGPTATLEQRLSVTQGASLEWLPQENILFSGARLRTRTRIELKGDATFVGWDITCLGRPSCGEPFGQGCLDGRLEVRHDGHPLLVEHQRVQSPDTLHAAAGLRGLPIQATLLAFPCDEDDLEAARAHEPLLGTNLGVTLLDRLLVARALGGDSEAVRLDFTALWRTLRPRLLGRPALPPRIWAT